MTVRELIEELQKQPPHARVGVVNDDRPEWTTNIGRIEWNDGVVAIHYSAKPYGEKS